MVGSEFALDPTPSPPMRSILNGVLVPNKEMCVSSVNGNLVAAVFFSQVACLSQETNKENKLILTTSMFPLPMLICVF